MHQPWRVERPKITQAVSDAEVMGSYSENAEYICGKKRLREIDRRLIRLGVHRRFTVVRGAKIENSGASGAISFCCLLTVAG